MSFAHRHAPSHFVEEVYKEGHMVLGTLCFRRFGHQRGDAFAIRRQIVDRPAINILNLVSR
jgi:hypothetical protein